MTDQRQQQQTRRPSQREQQSQRDTQSRQGQTKQEDRSRFQDDDQNQRFQDDDLNQSRYQDRDTYQDQDQDQDQGQDTYRDRDRDQGDRDRGQNWQDQDQDQKRQDWQRGQQDQKQQDRGDQDQSRRQGEDDDDRRQGVSSAQLNRDTDKYNQEFQQLISAGPAADVAAAAQQAMTGPQQSFSMTPSANVDMIRDISNKYWDLAEQTVHTARQISEQQTLWLMRQNMVAEVCAQVVGFFRQNPHLFSISKDDQESRR